MNSNLIRKMFAILVATVIAVGGGVFAIVYSMSRSAMRDDIRYRAIGVKDYILNYLSAEDLMYVGRQDRADRESALRIHGVLESVGDVGNLKRLYIAAKDDEGGIVTTLDALPGGESSYIPAGTLEMSLRRSLTEGVAIMGNNVYRLNGESVYAMFWPVLDPVSYTPISVICMEFDVGGIYGSHRSAALYGLALSATLILVFSIIAYISMDRTSEPYFKKLAYTDVLTGYENRMAFEHYMRECGPIADSGKSVTLFIFDVNDLKKINDEQGHKIGDLYLKNTADIIHKNINNLGRLYRIGGDEFASLMVGKTDSDAQGVLKALKNEKSLAYKTLSFNCACGYATFTKGVDESMRNVFKRADEAMYAEKKRQKQA